MPEDICWKTSLYIRLSREDEDKTESDSVVNQRSLLKDYIKEHPDFILTDTYIDDGYTGTSFDRPAFTRMIEDVKSGKINCIIVKDLSRFGRDYIQTGNYLEQLLPFLGCRFISILDNLDSFERPDEMSSIFVRFKHIMNDHYSHEISVKLRQTFDAQREDGKLVSSLAPYGYRKDPADKHHLLIDEEAANIVRDIFQWALSGMGMIRIAQKLNQLAILPPGSYRCEKGIYKGYNSNCTKLWRPNSVRTILGNNVYVGLLDQKKYTTRNHKDRKRIYLDGDNRILMPNTHEPIIEEWVFNEVQKRFQRRNRTAPGKTKVYLFSGFLRCADCGAAMIRNHSTIKGRQYVYYKCRTYNQKSHAACPDSHSIRHDVLEEAVFQTIRLQIHAVCDIKKVIDAVNDLDRVKAQSCHYSREVKRNQQMIIKKSELKKGLYEDWKAGILSQEEYLEMKAGYSDEIERLNQAIHELEQEEKALHDLLTRSMAWMERFTRHGELESLNRELLLSLVDTIYIQKDHSIHIKFQYEDEFARITNHITGNLQGDEGNESIITAQ